MTHYSGLMYRRYSMVAMRPVYGCLILPLITKSKCELTEFMSMPLTPHARKTPPLPTVPGKNVPGKNFPVNSGCRNILNLCTSTITVHQVVKFRRG